MKNKNIFKHFILSYNFAFIYIFLIIIVIGIFLLPKSAFLTTIDEESIIDLTNAERIKNNLESLTANQLLTKAAYEKGNALFKAQTFQHNIGEKKFSSWIKEAGYKYFYAGENLAIDFVTSEGAITAWLNSETHKKNILNENFKEIGVAVIEGNFKGNNTKIIVQIFGSPIPITTFGEYIPNIIPNYSNNNLDNYNFQNDLFSQNFLFHSSRYAEKSIPDYTFINEFAQLENYYYLHINNIRTNLQKIRINTSQHNNFRLSYFVLIAVFVLFILISGSIYNHKKLFNPKNIN